MSKSKRRDDLLNALYKIASGDFDIRLEVSDQNDDTDAVAVGINMLVEEIVNKIEVIRKIEKEKLALVEKEKNHAERMNKVMIGRELRMIELKKQIKQLQKELGEK